MNIVSYNCKNAKANRLMLEHLINNNDIIFLIEHWLRPDEQYIINDLISEHRAIFKSDMQAISSKKTRGRPFGGRCWLIKNSIKVLAVEDFNIVISMVKIALPNSVLFLFALWIPFDDGTSDRLTAFQSTLDMLESYIEYEVIPTNSCMAVIGDFNCDLER